jgi:hypothetical protein
LCVENETVDRAAPVDDVEAWEPPFRRYSKIVSKSVTSRY